MEELERRVWQRVAAREEAPGEADTELLLRRCRELERELGALGRDGSVPGQLRREEQEIARVLAGIRALHQGGGSQGVQRLRRCHHRARQALADYAARVAVPEVGLAYQYLAELERQQCLEILKLLGSGKW